MSSNTPHIDSLIPEITLSAATIERIDAYLTTHPEHQGIRLSIKKTGCSGLSYVIDYVTQPLSGDYLYSLDKGRFLCIDPSSYPYLKGMHMDYAKQGLNHKFVFNNPNQTGQCGCGESFTVE